jgi:acetyl esterase
LTRFNKFSSTLADYISAMALDPELLQFLGGPNTADLNDIAGSRGLAEMLTAEALARRPAPPEGVNFRDTLAEDGGGAQVPVRIYRRDDLASPSGALLFVHGGAFVFGDLELEHDRCLYYAANVDAVVVSVDYRLAPEFPYPAGLQDVTLALGWMVEHAQELGVDTERICVGGASAGGALAAGLVLLCRDEHGPSVAAQMLIYPVLDDRVATLSMEAFEIYDPWDGERSRQMWPLYLGHHGDALPYAAPARASDLSGLPVTFMMSCEEDPLRDEDLTFAQRLLHAGVSVELHHYRGTYHAFDVLGSETTVGRRALSEQALFLERVVGVNQTQ